MDKDKSEKLKEILNKTLSFDDIEKKLKEEIKASSLRKKDLQEIENSKNIKEEKAEKEITQEKTNKVKKEENKEEKNKVKKKDKEPVTPIKKQKTHNHKKVLNKNVVIPNVRETKKETSSINIFIYLASIIAIILLAVVIYLFTKENSKEVQIVSNNSSIKTLSKEEIILNKNIEKLKNTENILKKSIQEKIENLEKKAEEVPAKIDSTPIKESTKEKVRIEIKEVIKEKIVTKVIKLDKNNFKIFYNSSKYNTLKCYNFKAGDTFPTISCKKSINKFFKKNKDAIRFEIIPVIAQKDNLNFNKLKPNITKLDKKFQEKVKEYMNRGLSRERVLETTWYIIDKFGKDTVLTPTNYYVKSAKNNKGVIIKAYH